MGLEDFGLTKPRWSPDAPIANSSFAGAAPAEPAGYIERFLRAISSPFMGTQAGETTAPQTPPAQPQGALAAPVATAPAPSRPPPATGALGPPAPVAQTEGALAAPDAIAAGQFGAPPEAAPAPATTPAVAAAPRKTLMELYQDLIAKVPKDVAPKDVPLTDQQKLQLRMDFFTNLMKNSMKPGAYALGALGEAGQATSQGFTGMQDKNRAVSDRAIQQARDDAYKSIGMMDRDQDNQRLDRGEQRLEERNKVLDRNDAARLDLLRQQVAQGKWKAMNSGKTGTIVLYDAETGTTKDTGIKIDHGDSRSAEEKLVDRATRDPDFLKTMLELRGKTGDVTDSGRFKAMVDIMGKDPMLSSEDAGKKIDAAARLAAGGGPAAKGALSRKDARYTAALQDPKIGGDRAKLDAVLKARGVSVTD